ncbi:MAG: hypothetical protein IKH38_02380 [Clostridia bacterium]|nr:hypothetical protein [Clostridia bacterium]
MAKDDYHVIVYKVLGYLYRQLKKGEPVDPEMIRPGSKICPINETYWKYILTTMQEEKLIRGLDIEEGQEDFDPDDEQLKRLIITVKGIELLSDNQLGDRVDKLIKGILNIG